VEKVEVFRINKLLNEEVKILFQENHSARWSSGKFIKKWKNISMMDEDDAFKKFDPKTWFLYHFSTLNCWFLLFWWYVLVLVLVVHTSYIHFEITLNIKINPRQWITWLLVDKLRVAMCTLRHIIDTLSAFYHGFNGFKDSNVIMHNNLIVCMKKH
jgi:hypothetical protein